MTFSTMHLTAVAAGGAIGASLRYLIAIWLYNPLQSFPLATFVANMAGCFVIGAVLDYVNLYSLDGSLKVFLTIGLMGALTTYSTFIVELYQLWENHSPRDAVIYLVVSLSVGILFYLVGKSGISIMDWRVW